MVIRDLRHEWKGRGMPEKMNEAALARVWGRILTEGSGFMERNLYGVSLDRLLGMIEAAVGAQARLRPAPDAFVLVRGRGLTLRISRIGDELLVECREVPGLPFAFTPASDEAGPSFTGLRWEETSLSFAPWTEEPGGPSVDMERLDPGHAGAYGEVIAAAVQRLHAAPAAALTPGGRLGDVEVLVAQPGSRAFELLVAVWGPTPEPTPIVTFTTFRRMAADETPSVSWTVNEAWVPADAGRFTDTLIESVDARLAASVHRALGAATIGDVLSVSPEMLGGIDGFGKTSFDRLQAMLVRLGIGWREGRQA